MSIPGATAVGGGRMTNGLDGCEPRTGRTYLRVCISTKGLIPVSMYHGGMTVPHRGPEKSGAPDPGEGKRPAPERPKMGVESELERTFQFLAREFRSYYLHQCVPSPPRLSRREFAFTFFGKSFMMRHISFGFREELGRFLASSYPSAVYYSTAYYRTPDAATMGEKGWLGADLIFDLDADHIPGAADLSFGEMLDRVKQEVMKLIHEYLIPDFGFGERDMRVVFSGGRGYHIHIGRQDVLALTGHQRREIVDYITGKGVDIDKFLMKRAVGIRNPDSRFSKVTHTYRLPGADEGGWAGKITRGVAEVARSLEDREDAIRRLTRIKGVGKKTAEAVVSELFDSPAGTAKLEAIRQGNVDQFSSDRILKAFTEQALQEAAINLEGETDEPVTADIRRVIRLPGSLHGKTGFRVVPLTLGELDVFDPLTDAIALPDRPTGFLVKRTIEGRMKGEHFRFTEGERVDVPAYLAAFLAGRKAGFVE